MTGQIPARCRSATSFGPVCNQNSVIEFGLNENLQSPGKTGSNNIITRMWADAQRDGRQPNIGGALCESSIIPFLVPSYKVWWTAAARVPCSNAAKTRKSLKLEGVPQTRQQISAVSSPKFTIL